MVCATNENIANLIQKGKIRADFFYRIYKHVVRIKPLKERKGDISLLLKKYMKGKKQIILKDDALKILERYNYPANVRDIQNIVESLQDINKGIIRGSDLPEYIIKNKSRYLDKPLENDLINDYIVNRVKEIGLSAFVKSFKGSIIEHFIKEHNGNKTHAMKDMKYFSNRMYGSKDAK